jgi:hypothetical protein
MTKSVRIENADTNPSIEVVVTVMEGPVNITEYILEYPTQMHTETICEGKQIVITERKKIEKNG